MMIYLPGGMWSAWWLRCSGETWSPWRCQVGRSSANLRMPQRPSFGMRLCCVRLCPAVRHSHYPTSFAWLIGNFHQFDVWFLVMLKRPGNMQVGPIGFSILECHRGFSMGCKHRRMRFTGPFGTIPKKPTDILGPKGNDWTGWNHGIFAAGSIGIRWMDVGLTIFGPCCIGGWISDKLELEEIPGLLHVNLNFAILKFFVNEILHQLWF